MQQTLVVAGLACVIAAVVGGGLTAFGIQIPVINSRLRQVILGLVGVAFMAMARVPGSEPGSENGATRQVSTTEGGRIQVRCTIDPPAGRPGSEVEVRLLAFTEENDLPVPVAHLRIEAGGGSFRYSETATEVGNTTDDGVFTTYWRAPDPAAASYTLSVRVSKDGYQEGRTECTVPIQY